VTRKIGLLGGSFDPVHVAHIALAETALRELNLDAVQLIPAADPWQRPPLTASAQQRRTMLELAISGLPGLSVNPVELARAGPTYTLDTLRELPEGNTYTWLLGTDQLHNFCTWHGWQEIAARVDFAVAARPGTPVTPPPALVTRLRETGHTLQYLPFSEMPVSASDIRYRLAQGLSVHDLLPAATLAYIQAHRLYQSPLNPLRPLSAPTPLSQTDEGSQSGTDLP